MKIKNSKLKIQNYNSKLKVFILVFLTLTFNLSSLSFDLSEALAASPTPEATKPAAKELRDKVKQIVREKLQEVEAGQKRGFFGEISEIADLTLTLDTNQGKRQVNIATDAAIISKNRKNIESEDLEIGNFVIAMGYITEKDVLNARRLVVSEKPKIPLREVVFGKITDISTEEEVLTVKNEKSEIVYTLELTSKTTLNKKVKGEIKKVHFESIEKGDQTLAIGTPSENEHKLITAKTIYIVSTHSPSSEE